MNKDYPIADGPRHSFIAPSRSPMERGFYSGLAQRCVNSLINPAGFPADMTDPQSLDNPNTPPWMIELEKLIEVARKRREQLARYALKRMFKRPASSTCASTAPEPPHPPSKD